MIGFKLLAAGGAAALGYLMLKKPPAGVSLRLGESAIITKQISPMSVAEWQSIVTTNPAMLVGIAANIFPFDGDYSVENVMPQPAQGVFAIIIKARRSIVYKPQTLHVDKYTIRDIAARKID